MKFASQKFANLVVVARVTILVGLVTSANVLAQDPGDVSASDETRDRKSERASSVADGGESPDRSKVGKWKGEGDRAESALTPEEQERLRRLLQQVWSDPAVAQSRDEVRVASENLKRVLGEKLRALDPSVDELMEKMNPSQRYPGSGDDSGDGKFTGGRRPHHSFGGPSGLDYMARPPFYASLSEEQQGIYDAAYKVALASEELKGVIGRLDELRKDDDELRKLRTIQLSAARRIIFAAMVEADPRVSDLLPKEKERDEDGQSPANGEGDIDRPKAASPKSD